MRYGIEGDLIWENYLSPREGGLPMQSDIAAGGGPFNSPGIGSSSEDCEQTDDEDLKTLHVNLKSILTCSDAILQHASGNIPAWVQNKIAIANQYLIDASQHINEDDSEERDVTIDLVAV